MLGKLFAWKPPFAFKCVKCGTRFVVNRERIGYCPGAWWCGGMYFASPEKRVAVEILNKSEVSYPDRIADFKKTGLWWYALAALRLLVVVLAVLLGLGRLTILAYQALWQERSSLWRLLEQAMNRAWRWLLVELVWRWFIRDRLWPWLAKKREFPPLLLWPRILLIDLIWRRFLMKRLWERKKGKMATIKARPLLNVLRDVVMWTAFTLALVIVALMAVYLLFVLLDWNKEKTTVEARRPDASVALAPVPRAVAPAKTAPVPAKRQPAAAKSRPIPPPSPPPPLPPPPPAKKADTCQDFRDCLESMKADIKSGLISMPVAKSSCKKIFPCKK